MAADQTPDGQTTAEVSSQHGAMTTHEQHSRRGILAMLAAMALFTGNDVLMKLATATYPVGQVIAIRSLFAGIATLVLVIVLGSVRDLKWLTHRKAVARGLLEGLIAATFITALSKLPVSNVNAIMQASSLIIVAFAAILRLEVIGWRRWAAVIVGFIGVLIIVRPSAEGFNAYAVLALFSACLIAIRDLVTRGISKDIPSAVITLSTMLIVGAAGLSMWSFETWQPLVWNQIFYLLGAAAFVAGGNLAIIIAFRAADVSLVSGFRYSILVFSIIAGAVIWNEWPDALALLGSALIVSSGLYAMHRQRLRERQIRASLAAADNSTRQGAGT